MTYLLKKYYYLGFDQKTLTRCNMSILRYNIYSLRTVSMIISILLIAFSLVPVLIENKPYKALFYFGIAAIEFLVFWFAKRLHRQESPSATAFLFGFFVYYIGLLSFGLYVSVLDAPGHAVNFIIYLSCAQIFFVVPPLRCLLANVCAYGAFVLLDVIFKSPAYWAFDFINAFIAVLLSVIFGWIISHILLKETLSTLLLEEERNHFRQECETDVLTGLNNRRFFFQTAPYYLDAWLRAHKHICMMMLDLDYFKNYNDTYGHPMGDAALRAVGGVLKQIEQQSGVYSARVGGEEFAVILAENRSLEADVFARKLSSEIKALEILHERSEAASIITASIGLYFFNGEHTSIEELYQKADAALYEAKRRGRNCIVRSASDSDDYIVIG